MCHLIFISTDCDDDFGAIVSDQLSFRAAEPNEAEVMRTVLQNRNLWQLESRFGGCSCHFRHLLGECTSEDFAEPVDWCPEDDDDCAATYAAYDFLAQIVGQGHNVDVLDTWNGELKDDIPDIQVSIGEVMRSKFRFFENTRFVLVE